MKKKKSSNIFLAIFAILFFGYFLYGLSKRIFTDALVNDSAVHIKAVVIDERNYYPNQRGINPEFSYSYQFEINGHKYKGDCLDKTLHLGDSVEVKYNKTFPCFNKPVHPKD